MKLLCRSAARILARLKSPTVLIRNCSIDGPYRMTLPRGAQFHFIGNTIAGSGSLLVERK
jgi:hypothetical protein